ncbi:hypothetical protein EV138_4014 [Kribbella voronezhensis]|uniref:Uncharacterized protein n=2 Tax=Kribbella voronezhensis TaxID=2512212 RepID=A0A4V6Q5Y6_9ACTN|nr:hypothetical protein EV138_4014 [Kribbella voronezhensis]
MLLLLAVGCASLTGCGPGQSGMIGLSVDDAGRTIVVLQDCKGDIDKLKLVMLGRLKTDPETVLVEWSNPKSPKGVVQFPLVEGAGKWKPQSPVPEFDVTRHYQLRGKKENDWSNAIDITFTPTELKDLQPGQVLRWKRGLGEANEIVTMDEYTPKDCG